MMVPFKDKKFINKFTDFSRACLYLLSACMMLWMVISALMKDNEWRTTSDGIQTTLVRLFAIVIAITLSALIGSLFDKLTVKYKRAEVILVSAFAALFWAANLWWVSIVPYAPEGDQAVVWYNAVLALDGEFPMFVRGGQMFIYPQQQGLSFLYELLFRVLGTTSYRMIGYVNATLAPITLVFGYECVKICFGKKAAIRFLPLITLCLPYIIYAPYVYGDIPSIALTFILLWAVLKAVQTNKKRYYILAPLIATEALFCRMNMWICFIGIAIGLVYHCFYKKSMKPLVLALCIVVCAALGMSGLKQFNSYRSGYPVAKGMPSVLWIAMGLQQSQFGAGYYNDYNKKVFRESDFDRELASAIGKQEIKDRIHIFLSDGYQTKLFFEQKMKTQWIDPLFESIKFTGTFETKDVEKLSPRIVSFYYGEGYSIINRFSEYMLCIVYVFAIIGLVKRYFEKHALIKDIPLIIFVGGFLFSIMWEAKARYMLPYYVLLHLYASYGLAVVSTEIKILLKKFSNKKEIIEV